MFFSLTLSAPVDERDDGRRVRDVAVIVQLYQGAQHRVQPSPSLHIVKAGDDHPELGRQGGGGGWRSPGWARVSAKL